MITLNGRSCLSFYYNLTSFGNESNQNQTSLHGSSSGGLGGRDVASNASLEVTVDGKSVFRESGGNQWRLFQTHLSGTVERKVVYSKNGTTSQQQTIYKGIQSQRIRERTDEEPKILI